MTSSTLWKVSVSLRLSQEILWTVTQQMQIENPRDYHVSDVGMGDKVIPNEEESLEGVAFVAGSRIDDTTSIDYTGDYISYFLRISSERHSHSLSEPGLRPFVERDDILQELKLLGFDDENIDINTSVSPARFIDKRRGSIHFQSATNTKSRHI